MTKSPFAASCSASSGWSSTPRAWPPTSRSSRRRRPASPSWPACGTTSACLLDAYGSIAKAAGEGRPITPAAEWLLDNYHLVEQQVREVRTDLPRGLLSPAAEAERRPAGRLSAGVRPGLGLRRPHRQPLRSGDADALRARLPERPAAQHRRTVGGGDHAAHRPGRKSPALGQAHHEPAVGPRGGRPRRRQVAGRQRSSPPIRRRWRPTSRRRSPTASSSSSSSGCATRIPRRRRRCAGWKSGWRGRERTPTSWCARNISSRARRTSPSATSSPACA